MTTETITSTPRRHDVKVFHKGRSSGALYGMGMIGAWVYFIGHATTFWLGVLGFLKGLVWPAILVYEAFKYLD